MFRALYAVDDAGPVALQVQAASMADLFEGLPLGVYSALRTFHNHRFLDLDAHIARTRRSLAAIDSAYVLDEARLRRAIDRACREAGHDNLRLRFDVLASTAEVDGHRVRELVALEAFEPLAPETYATGVKTRVATGIERGDPTVKRAAFVEQRRAFESGDANVHEHLLVHEDRLLEGFSSNFYAVLDGVLWTAGEGVLEGVTRRVVLDLATELGIEVRLEAPRRADVPRFAEAGISSSSRGYLPVVAIDGLALGAGRPGPVSTRIVAAYDAYVLRNARPA